MGSNALAFSSLTHAGSLIIVEVDWSDTASFSSIADSQGNAYVQVGTEQQSTIVGVRSRLYYAANILGGSNTVTTVVSGAPAFHELYIHEYSGVSTSSPLDAYSVRVATGTTFNSGSVLTSSSNDLLYGIEIDSNTAGADSGWTTRSTLDSNVAADSDGSLADSYSFGGASGGAYIAWIAAFKQAGPQTGDATAPSVPSGLSATGVSISQINLSWNASTDPDNSSGQITYRVIRDGTAVATTAAGATTYQDTNLLPQTSYSYAVLALDPAGNASSASSSVTGSTQALPGPVISSFDANPSGITQGLQTTLSWSVSNATSVSIDNGVGDVTNLTSKSVWPQTSVTYTLTATNGAGLAAAQTSVVVSSDIEPPSTPANPTLTTQTSTQFELSWPPSTDNVGVAGYKIFRDGTQIGTSATATYTDTGLSDATTYTYTVSAYDAAGNESAKSGGTSGSTSQSSAPSYSTSFPFSENPLSENGNWIGGKSVGLEWTDVVTESGLAHGTLTGADGFDDSLAMLLGGWGPDQTASATVRVGNPHDSSDSSVFEEIELLLRWSLSPHNARGYEVNFGTASNGQYIQVVRWNGPFGNFDVLDSLGLEVQVRDGDVIKATIAGAVITAYVNDTQVLQVTDDAFTSGNPGIGFYLQGAADNSEFGLTSFTASSNSVGSDAPSTPTNLSATAESSSGIDLSWTASTSASSVIDGYKVFRNGSEVGTSATTSFSDSGLAALTTYTYTVSAFDTNGGTSAQSASASATTWSEESQDPGRSWAHVQTNASNSSSGSNALAFSASTRAGSLVVVEVDWSDQSSFVSITDNQGNVYSQIGAEQQSTTIGVRSRLYYAANVRGGAHTITTVVSGSPAFHELYIHEYSGLDVIAPLDAFSARVATGTTFTSNGISATSAHDLLYGIEIDSSTSSADTGWTTRSTLDSNVAADMDGVSPGVYSFSGRSGGASIAWIVAFKQAP